MAQVQVCRTCLSVIEKNTNFVSLDATDPSPNISEIKSKLEACVPEMTFDIVKRPVICSPCIVSLESAYEFKRNCLRTEEAIYEYMMECEENEVIDLGLLASRALKSTTPVIIKTEIDDSAMDSSCATNDITQDKVSLDKGITLDKEIPLDKETPLNKEITPTIPIIVPTIPEFVITNPEFVPTIPVIVKTEIDDSAMDSSYATNNISQDKVSLDKEIPPIIPVIIKTEPDCGMDLSQDSISLDREIKLELIETATERHESSKIIVVTPYPPVRPCSVTLRRLPEDQVAILQHSSLALAVDIDAVDVDSIDVEQVPSEAYPTNAQQSKCCVCKIFFRSKEDLKKHSLVHTRNGMKVSLIGYPFSATTLEPMRMELYKRKGFKERRFRCGICNLNVEGSLEAHLRIHTGEKPYQCILCEFCTSQSDLLQTHMQTHSNITNNHLLERQYKCNSCQFCTAGRTALKNHMESHKSDDTFPKGFTETYTCVTCMFSTISKERLMEHLKLEPRAEPLVNDQAKPANNHLQTSATAHKVNIMKNSIKPVINKTIVKPVINKTAVKPVICKTAKQVKPYKCGMCKFASAQKDDYRKHWKVHKKKPQCRCAYCEFTCETTAELATHTSNHPDSKFYKCGNCDFVTDYLTRLDCHITIHDNETAYKCFFCHYRTYVRTYYTDHTRVVHSNSAALLCGKKNGTC